MIQKLMNNIIQGMLGTLNNSQLQKLQIVLQFELKNYFASENNEDNPHKDEENKKILDAFIEAKRIEGCSEKSLKYYRTTIDKMIVSIDKRIQEIDTDDIRNYLTEYQKDKGSSKVTIDNMRRIFSSLFTWLEDEDYILKSPVRRIHKIKSSIVVKETYSDEALEKMRDNCDNLRDLALIDILASTGMRVGELVLLNREDINFAERECIVLGKGDKERIVYFDARTKIHLQNYLNDRTDSEKALFVTLKAPYNRLQIGGVEARIRLIGSRLDIDKCHPHKFRRTLATMAIDKGMPIEQLQQLLGHKKIDTTLHMLWLSKVMLRMHIGNILGR